MKICFVRHGNDKNDKLTRLGVKQCKLVSKDLDYENITHIYCSPKNRTRQTARIIAKRLGIHDITIDNRLKEREQLRTQSTDPKDIEYNNNYLNYNFSQTNPEGCKEFCGRVFEFLREIINEYGDTDQTILVVAHSSVAYALNTFFTGVPKDGKLIWVRVGNCSKLCYEVNTK